MSGTIWVYPRVSTKEQDDYGTSLPTQEKECREYIERQDWQGRKVVVLPEDYSGLTLDRPVLGRIRAELKAGDVFLVHRADRLSRDEDATDAMILYKQWKKQGVELHTAEDGLIKGTPKLMLLMLKSAMSAEYVISLKANAKRGRRGRAELKQRLVGGYDLYGYTYVPGDRKSQSGGIRVIDPKEARRVRYIFHLYTREGVFLSGISMRLAQIGVPAPHGGPRWYAATIRNLLTNPAYTGRHVAFKTAAGETEVPLPDSTPRLIDDMTFALAQRRLAENKTRGGKKRWDYELSGITYCEECGTSCTGTATPRVRADGESVVHVYYQCRRRKADHDANVSYGERCTVPIMPAGHIEPRVWGGVRAYILQPELIEQEIAQRVESMGERTVEADLETVREALAELDARQGALVDYAMNHARDDYGRQLVADRQAKIDAEREPLVEKEQRLKATVDALYLSDTERRDVRLLCAAMAEDIDSLDGAGRNEVMRRLRVRVEIGRDAVSVTGLFPKFVVPHAETVGAVYSTSSLTLHESNGIPFSFSFPRVA